MAISEQNRHELHCKLEEFLGPVEAATLMGHLPPTGWADVATKADLDHNQALTSRDIEALGGRIDALDERLGGRIDALDERLGGRIEALGLELSGTLGRELGQVYKELAAHTRTITFACLGAVMTSGGLAFAAARL